MVTVVHIQHWFQPTETYILLLQQITECICYNVIAVCLSYFAIYAWIYPDILQINTEECYTRWFSYCIYIFNCGYILKLLNWTGCSVPPTHNRSHNFVCKSLFVYLTLIQMIYWLMLVLHLQPVWPPSGEAAEETPVSGLQQALPHR